MMIFPREPKKISNSFSFKKKVIEFTVDAARTTAFLILTFNKILVSFPRSLLM